MLILPLAFMLPAPDVKEQPFAVDATPRPAEKVFVPDSFIHPATLTPPASRPQQPLFS